MTVGTNAIGESGSMTTIIASVVSVAIIVAIVVVVLIVRVCISIVSNCTIFKTNNTFCVFETAFFPAF